jgi:hypothetical protein
MNWNGCGRKQSLALFEIPQNHLSGGIQESYKNALFMIASLLAVI